MKRNWRIEIAVITEELDFKQASQLRGKLAEVLENTSGVKRGLSSSILEPRDSP